MPNISPQQIITAIGTMGASTALPGGGLYGGQGQLGGPSAPGGPPGANFHDILNSIAPGILGQTGGGISPQYIAGMASSQAQQQGHGGASSQQALSNLQQMYPGLFGGQ